MLICIGPKSVGKTLLLRRLQQVNIHCDPYDEIFSTVPTVGVNIANIALTKQDHVKVHELGGSMAAIWPMHFNGCKGIIYVIDAVNLQQISCASILLYEALTHEYLQNCKFLIVLNKTDVNSSIQVSEIKYLIRLDDVIQHAKQEINVVESSCLTGKGIKEIKQWLLKFKL